MPTSTFNPAATAELLLDQWRRETQLEALPVALRPQTLAEGYAAQDALFRAAGGVRGGWKLGVGSPAQLRAGNLSRPLIGQLEAQRLHRSGAQVRLPLNAPVTVECEIAFVLARDLPPLAGREVDPADIRHACVTFELVRSRFVDRRAVGWPSFVADNVGFEALVVSAPFSDGLDADLLRQVDASATVSLDGQVKARAQSGDDVTDPLRSLAALYAHAADRNVTLRAGEIVSTGAMCKPFDIVGAGHVLRATYLDQELMLSL